LNSAGVIFNGKPINEITDAEIARLVAEHLAKRQHLELKLTVNHRVWPDEGQNRVG